MTSSQGDTGMGGIGERWPWATTLVVELSFVWAVGRRLRVRTYAVLWLYVRPIRFKLFET